MPRKVPPAAALNALAASTDARVRARARAAEKLAAAIGEQTRARHRATFEIAKSLAALLRERLYEPLGHATFASLAAALGLGRAQAFKLATLGAHSTLEEVERLGVEGSYRACRGRDTAPGPRGRRRTAPRRTP